MSKAISSDGELSCRIIPRPVSIEYGSGCFTLTPDTAICIEPNTEELAAIGAYLAAQLAPVIGAPPPSRKERGEQVILLTTQSASRELGDEGYELQVSPRGVTIRAPKPAGLFYGVQTLRQLLPEEIEESKTVTGVAWTIPAQKIVDKPRFAWRGLLLDVCRHFRTVEFVKRYIDLLAYHKLNVLHWHLTEDQGWRIEIKKYPKLTEIGAWRGEGKNRHGGFYTQSEVREVVRYAASRYVRVMPEIEMPGHSTAAVASYPEFSCTGGPFKVETRWGIHKEVLCAGNEQCFEFIENVLDEVLPLFPSKFIHIGGDEVLKTRWKECPRCQKRIRDEGLKDEHELQSYFIRRVDKFLTSRNRRLVGWDEILEGGLASGATVMSWRGMNGAIAAARMGHDVIATPNTHCYLDWPLTITPIDKSYSFEPVPAEFNAEQARRVLGLQGNMWSEFYPLNRDIDRQVFPRLCALAEIGWSESEQRNFTDFSHRLETHLCRLKRMGIDYTGVGPGQLVGHWSEKELSSQFKSVDWDVSFFAREPVKFEAAFTFDSGRDALCVQWVALLVDGVEVSRDTHDAMIGPELRGNVYRLELPVFKPDTAYTLRASLRGEGGADSHGSIWFKRA